MKQQRQGAGILFLNCKAVPEKLLGKKIPFPPGLLAVPRMRNIPDAKVHSLILYIGAKGAGKHINMSIGEFEVLRALASTST